MSLTTRTLTAPATGRMALDLSAADLEAEVVFTAGAGQARIELSGPAEVVEAATAAQDAGTWRIRVPEPAPTVLGGGGVTVIGGSVRGSIVVSGGTTVINGRVFGRGTAVITDTGEPVRARVVLPAGADLVTDITAGSLTTRGRAGAIDHTGHSACLRVAEADSVAATLHNGTVRVGEVIGEADVRTHNGAITVGRTGSHTRAATHNGAVAITAGGDGPIRATTHNGPITIRRAGFSPKVRTRTHNGSEHID
ncbi:hypothetical protein J0910_01580 [Nocardiopsis sp. CNT-189]|uniref:hypothetical protein n=1 Tax=Nocardiopsis oceanisediminis TaxID=2816862 RepID=UPI003B3855CF